MTATVMVVVVAGHQARTGDVCEAKRGSMVWAALVNEPVGKQVESWGITYERIEVAADLPPGGEAGPVSPDDNPSGGTLPDVVCEVAG